MPSFFAKADPILKRAMDCLRGLQSAVLRRFDAPDENTIRLREQLETDVEVFDQVFFPGMSGR